MIRVLLLLPLVAVLFPVLCALVAIGWAELERQARVRAEADLHDERERRVRAEERLDALVRIRAICDVVEVPSKPRLELVRGGRS